MEHCSSGGGGSGYVLCLDDDVALHPGTIGRLVDELEGDAAAFMATGAARARAWSHTLFASAVRARARRPGLRRAPSAAAHARR